MNPYRRRIFSELQNMLTTIGPLDQSLDVGAGDGWFAMCIRNAGICRSVTAVDVAARASTYYPIGIYDGAQLPASNATYDLVYAIDVVHHADEPLKLLAEMARCTRRYLLLKDHTWETWLGWLALFALDEMGNRRFGIRCVYKYQRGREWDAVLAEAGLRLVHIVNPLRCHVGMLGHATNDLQFLSLWERN
jgi:SAM-dependent methyltransferase